MSKAQTSQLFALVIAVVFISLGVLRRMRPQPVRPNRLMVTAAVITVVVVASLVATGASLVSDPLALVLIPVFLAGGALLGFYLVRTMSFWSDPSTGALWMKGGALFAVILIATIALRIGFRAAITGSAFGAATAGSQHGFLYDLSADLLFLSLGLWVARAFFLYQRHRQHVTAG